MFHTQDTIVAISSAAGPAGRAIVRLSGPAAIALAQGVFFAPLAELPGFRAVTGVVGVGGDWPFQCPARLYLFRAPRSYTRQDVVELHVPGEVIAEALLRELLSAGARQAQAGEFTARAFFAGRLDLAKAQAVADIIDAEADAQLRSAVGMLEGELSRLCRAPADTLTQALALVESSIDFADEHIELENPAVLADRVAQACASLQRVLQESGQWVSASAQPHVAIAGAPNAGKSSLLNALSGLDRAIVSSVAGTTRDVLSAPARLAADLEVILLDAAGLERSDDPLWQTANRSARQAVAAAQAVLFVVDATGADVLAQRPGATAAESAAVRESTGANTPANAAGVAPLMDPPLMDGTSPAQPLPMTPQQLLRGIRDLIARSPLLVVATKVDLLESRTALAGLAQTLGQEVLPVSSITSEGLDLLRRRLANVLATQATPHSGGLLLHGRQRRGIGQAVAAARQACEILTRSRTLADEAELAAAELRSALHHLAEITGQVVSEDILAAIFSRFCIGK